MANFADILSKQSSAIERPKPLPVGTYQMVVDGLPEFKEIGQKQTPACEFKIKIVAPHADVDMQALTEVGGCSGKSQRLTFFLTEDALYRLKEFLNSLGIEEGKMTLGERINLAPNRSFLGSIKHRPSPDGTMIYAEIGKTAAA